jgi:hypothetical protein
LTAFGASVNACRCCFIVAFPRCFLRFRDAKDSSAAARRETELEPLPTAAPGYEP